MMLAIDKVIHQPIQKNTMDSEKLNDANQVAKGETDKVTIDPEKNEKAQEDEEQCIQTPKEMLSDNVIRFILKCMELFDHPKIHLHIL